MRAIHLVAVVAVLALAAGGGFALSVRAGAAAASAETPASLSIEFRDLHTRARLPLVPGRQPGQDGPPQNAGRRQDLAAAANAMPGPERTDRHPWAAARVADVPRRARCRNGGEGALPHERRWQPMAAACARADDGSGARGNPGIRLSGRNGLHTRRL